MIETFAALLLAHVLADFVLQTSVMAEQKARASMLTLHAALVLLAAMVCTGQVARWEILALAGAHIVIDLIKTRFSDGGLTAFIADQGAHFVTLAATAAIAPDLWSSGAWAQLGAPNETLAAMVLVAGALIATRAGGFAVGLLMVPYAARVEANGLPQGGQLIGLLERGLIFVMILVGQPAGIGFLIAAKSILRFEATSAEAKAEYVIIGTLASFGWAMVAAYATLGLMSAFPPLEIVPLRP